MRLKIEVAPRKSLPHYQETVPCAKNNFAIDVNRTASSWVNIERHLPHGTYEK